MLCHEVRHHYLWPSFNRCACEMLGGGGRHTGYSLWSFKHLIHRLPLKSGRSPPLHCIVWPELNHPATRHERAAPFIRAASLEPNHRLLKDFMFLNCSFKMIHLLYNAKIVLLCSYSCKILNLASNYNILI